MEKVQRARKTSPDGLAIARAYRPPASLILEAGDELPN